jgi:hypothetical protein
MGIRQLLLSHGLLTFNVFTTFLEAFAKKAIGKKSIVVIR